MTAEEMIKEAMKAGKMVIGRNTVVSMLKSGSLESVVRASNYSPGKLKELEYYSKISKIDIQIFGGTSARLGQLCGKPFNIAVLGIKK